MSSINEVSTCEKSICPGRCLLQFALQMIFSCRICLVELDDSMCRTLISPTVLVWRIMNVRTRVITMHFSFSGKGHPDPNIGGLGNIFCNIEVPGMQGKVPTSELEAKLLNPPTVLGNDKRLESAYACATMSLRRECGLCQTGTWSWESLWDDRITATRFQGGYDASSCSMCKRDMKIMDSPGTRLQEMAEWHTYIVTEKLEVHPSSVAKGMDLLGELPFTKRNDQVLKKKCVVGKHEVNHIQPNFCSTILHLRDIKLPSSISMKLEHIESFKNVCMYCVKCTRSVALPDYSCASILMY